MGAGRCVGVAVGVRAGVRRASVHYGNICLLSLVLCGWLLVIKTGARGLVRALP